MPGNQYGGSTRLPLFMPEPRVAAILLAAGASTRMGRPKQLIRVGGETLLRRTARIAVEAGCSPVIVVLGSRAEEICPELDGLPVTIAVNKNWAEGMASSLRCGLASISELWSAAARVLVLVCDQPLLSVEHIRSLLRTQAAGNALVTASLYRDRAGVPAVFASQLFPELMTLQGDQGARELILAHKDQVETIAWSAGALDVDLPEDLEAIGAQ